jgi:hypothetical protein
MGRTLHIYFGGKSLAITDYIPRNSVVMAPKVQTLNLPLLKGEVADVLTSVGEVSRIVHRALKKGLPSQSFFIKDDPLHLLRNVLLTGSLSGC